MERAWTCILLLLVAVITGLESKRYEPNWASIDSRPLPSWYDEAKFGIFIHWSVFSVPSFGNEHFWDFWVEGRPEYVEFMKKNYPPDFTYADFAKDFTAEFYDPVQWAKLFKDAGAKYAVLVSKHHDGFSNFPSDVRFNWNSVDVGPKRDLVGDFVKAIRNESGLHLGLYRGLFDQYDPLYMRDAANNFTTRVFPRTKAMPELYDLVNMYKPDLIWSDGSRGPDKYWQATDFLAWLYNDSPVKDTVVVNDRWCTECVCKNGGYYTCSDRYNPGVLQPHKWESCQTVDRKSWGFRREATLSDYQTIHDLLSLLASAVSCGGNLLLNVGPSKDGRIHPIFEERLRQMGDWLKINGEAIYSSKPWKHQNDTKTKDVWYTSKGSSVYAIVLDWPANNTLKLGAPMTTSQTTVSMLGFAGKLNWKAEPSGGLSIMIPPMSPKQLPSQYVWTFKLDNLKM